MHLGCVDDGGFVIAGGSDALVVTFGGLFLGRLRYIRNKLGYVS